MSEPCTPAEFWAPEEPEVIIDEPGEGIKPTPQQWVAHFIRASREERIRIAAHVLANGDTAALCRMKGHEQRLLALTAQVLDQQERIYRLSDEAAWARLRLHKEGKKS